MAEKHDKPLIALLMGDAAGIGPELVLKALANNALTSQCIFVVLGNVQTLDETAETLGIEPDFVVIESPAEAHTLEHGVALLECELDQNADFQWGVSTAANGANVIEQLRKAVALGLDDEIDGVAIAPLNKEAMHKTGFGYSDEIAFLGALGDTKVRTVVTWNGIYRSSVTGHVPLRAVPNMISQELILPVAQNLWKTMGELGVEPRRIGVAGLNPHAGEDGAFGDEEIEVIAPAIKVARGIRHRYQWTASCGYHFRPCHARRVQRRCLHVS